MNAPRLHPDMVQAVKERVDIVEVIGDYVVLKKRGRDYVGLCPFHEEKSPSFTVSPTKQVYYCFGCGEGGNAIKFLKEIGKQSFGDVVLDLARRYQVPIQTLEPAERQELQRQLSEREQLYEIVAVAAAFYHHTLFQPQGEEALAYVRDRRRLTLETIKQFQLGYAPDGWETLYRYLVEQKRYPLNLVEQVGLIRPRQTQTGYYDQFRHRLMIPIRDGQGRAIAFGSRTLGQDEPKYLNSPETPLFNKGKTLFGLDGAKKAIQKTDQAVVVEGYFDVMALHQAGIGQTVAALGTALSRDQVQSLLRFSTSKELIFNFDADRAGVKATQRAIQEIEPLVYSGQVVLRILNLPAGKDADEFIHSGPTAIADYQAQLATAPLWLEWQLQQLLLGKNLNQATDFEQVSKGMVALLKRLTDPNQQVYYVQWCAECLSQGDVRLMALQMNSLLQQLRPASVSQPAVKPIFKNPENDRLARAEACLLRIFLHCPAHRREIEQILLEKDLLFSFAPHRDLWRLIQELCDHYPLEFDEENNLLALIEATYLELENNAIPALWQLTETTREDLLRPQLLIPVAIAEMEISTWRTYQRYCETKLRELNHPDPHYQQQLIRAIQAIQTLSTQGR